MKGFYIRWSGILILMITIGVLGFLRFQKEVDTLWPAEVLQTNPSETVRMIGTVQPGTLTKEGFGAEGSLGRANFGLRGEEEEVIVHYKGIKPDNLRELKTLVVEGRWDPISKGFQANEISVVPNYRFIAAAYLVAIVPLGIFLFRMERRMRLLYFEIKETTVYEPEKIFDKE